MTPDLAARLIEAARRARENAYAPYSEYRVGAAIATEDGSIFTGCNVENASFGAAICAERGAIARMIASGASAPIACAIVVGGEAPGPPCGICRQVLAEFAKDMPIVLVADGSEGEIREDCTLLELYPKRFEL